MRDINAATPAFSVFVGDTNGPEVPWRFEAIGPTDRVATNPC
jgi:hypothetical protein